MEIYLDIIKDKIDELKAEDDIEHGRVISHEEMKEYFRLKCQKK